MFFVMRYLSARMWKAIVRKDLERVGKYFLNAYYLFIMRLKFIAFLFAPKFFLTELNFRSDFNISFERDESFFVAFTSIVIELLHCICSYLGWSLLSWTYLFEFIATVLPMS